MAFYLIKIMKKIFLIIFIVPFIFVDCQKDKNISQNALRMQIFVRDIAAYARGFNPDFIIIPQNGAELCFKNANPEDSIMSLYINNINGIGIEELFYNGILNKDEERLMMLRKLKSTLKIMVSDFVSNNANILDAVQQSKNEGFISFPRSSENYDYKLIPTIITDENTNDIRILADAKNYLYLISTDNFTNKQAMINAIAATNYDVILIDLFFDETVFTASEIQQLKVKANGGRRLVISYISIGSAENYRYYWQSGWKIGNPSWIKKKYEGYNDEFWVEFWSSEWQKIIFGNNNSYIKKIIDANFDGAYLDNVEAYYFLEKK